jgi:hypothetical protein
VGHLYYESDSKDHIGEDRECSTCAGVPALSSPYMLTDLSSSVNRGLSMHFYSIGQKTASIWYSTEIFGAPNHHIDK